MKVRMVKMGSDIDETLNHRIRGIIPTEDGKYLFIEISQGNRIARQYTNLSKSDYLTKYPYEKYIYLESCFRVDSPKDYKDNYSQEYREYDRKLLTNIEYTNENLIKLLQKFNKKIDSIELTKDYYIDKFCEENGFFKLYDERLKHQYSNLKISWWDLEQNGKVYLKCKYICYSKDESIEYDEEQEKRITISDCINEFGIDKVRNLLNEYINNLFKERDNLELKEDLLNSIKDIGKDKILEQENDTIDII